MFAMRCQECGEVRWTLFGRPENIDPTCPACGTQMVQERRHPGHVRLIAGDERRDRTEPSSRFTPT